MLSKGTHTDPLYSSHGCADLLQTLIKGGGRKGAAHLAQHVRNLNHVNVEGETALHLACERGYDDVVAALVSYDRLYHDFCKTLILTGGKVQCPLKSSINPHLESYRKC